MTLTLTYVGRFTKDKNGQPLVGKNGRSYTSLRIKCNEYGDRWISGFDSKETQGWKEGDTVEAEVIEKGEYLNLNVPRASGKNEDILATLRQTYSENILATLRQTYSEARAANINADKCRVLITDLTRMLLKKGVIELADTPFPTNEDVNDYGK